MLAANFDIAKLITPEFLMRSLNIATNSYVPFNSKKATCLFIFLSVIVMSACNQSPTILVDERTEINSGTKDNIDDFPDSIQRLEIDDSSGSPVIPDDVLKEITWIDAGGWKIDNCSYQETPIVFEDTGVHLEHGDTIEIRTCGWQFGEEIQIESIPPNGDSANQIVFADEKYAHVYFNEDIGFAHELGAYKTRFTGKSGVLEFSYEIVEHTQPRVVYRDFELLLDNFQPNETVKMLVYERLESASIMNFKEWLEVQVDENGQIVIPTRLKHSYFFIGNQSGPLSDKALK